MLGAFFATGNSLGNFEMLVAIVVIGFLGWRWKRGDFYKAVAVEKTAEVDKLHAENERLRQLTDVTPIVAAMHEVAVSLERHAKTNDAVFQKVADMNGSLRAHSEAMKALADRLILDEAARALLATAASRNPPQEGAAS